MCLNTHSLKGNDATFSEVYLAFVRSDGGKADLQSFEHNPI